MRLLIIFTTLFLLQCWARNPSDEEISCAACEVVTRRLNKVLAAKPAYLRSQRGRSDIHEITHDICQNLATYVAVGKTKKTRSEYQFLTKHNNQEDYVEVHSSTQVNDRLIRLCKQKVIDPNVKAINEYLFFNWDLNLRNKICFHIAKACKYQKKYHPEENHPRADTIEVMPGVHVPDDYQHHDAAPHNLHQWTLNEPPQKAEL